MKLLGNWRAAWNTQRSAIRVSWFRNSASEPKERTWKILDAMAPIARAHGCSPARLALAWLLAKPAVTSVIIGAKHLDQLNDNLPALAPPPPHSHLTPSD